MKPAQPGPLNNRPHWLDRVRTLIPVVALLACTTIGVPLFLRMPVWCDITLYDMAARNVLCGGVHYRDLFDTNTPGYVWLLAGLRAVLGWSSESLRATDLVIVGGVVLALDRLAKLGGATALNRLWMAAGCSGFYLFTQEMVHAQRDVWLALPALLAVLSRLKRIARPIPHLFRGVFVPAAGEGLLWAAAVWIKPHLLLVSGGFWLLTAPRLAGTQLPDPADFKRRWLRVLLVDLGGSVLAGGVVGAAGVAYLFASGTWEPFREVMTVWNVGYMDTTFGTLHSRAAGWLNWFPPWSYLLPVAAGLTLFGLFDARFLSPRVKPAGGPGGIDRLARPALWYKGGTDAQRYSRAAVGLVYLLWCGQSLVLQRNYEYVHAAEVLVSLAVMAAFRWNPAELLAGWFVALHLAWGWFPDALHAYAGNSHGRASSVRDHRLFDPDRLALWPGCFTPGLPPAAYYRRQDALRVETKHPASIGWEELNEVADFLREQGVADGELVCWHDSPHPLYLMLGVKPGLRFMHVNTARLIGGWAEERVYAEFAANTAARYVVIDLKWYAFLEPDDDLKPRYAEPGPTAADLLPDVYWREPDAGVGEDNLRALQWLKSYLPFDTSRTVFRSTDPGTGRKGCGRYLVFQLR